MTETAKFIEYGSSILGENKEALKDIYQLVLSGNPNDIKSYPWLSQQLHKKYGIPLEVADASLMLVSDKVEDLDFGRKGMGNTLFTFINYIIQKLPPN